MITKNIELIEGLKHELSFVLTGVDDVGDFEPFGYVSPLGCNHQSCKIEKIDESYFMPALKNGIYNYQIFVKQLSTNKDFLTLEGKIEVKNSLMAENNTSLGETELLVSFDANTTEIHCEITKGLKGDNGLSTYEIAKEHGFIGTEKEWLNSLKEDAASIAINEVKPMVEYVGSAVEEIEAKKEVILSAQNEIEENKNIVLENSYKAENSATNAKVSEENAEANKEKVEELHFEIQELNLETKINAQKAETSANSAANSEQISVAKANAASVSETNAEQSATAAATSASNAETSANSAAKSATNAANSAEQVVESAGTINAHDVYWAAWFKRQTDLDNHFKNTKLDGFNYELPNLKIGRYAFFSTGLKKWSVALPLLEDGEGMFANCPFTEWNLPLPKLQNANVMFGGYTAAKFSTWTVDLPSLIYAYVMFEAKPLTEFHGNLDKLKTAQGMFTRCSALTVFDSALPALSDAPEMFNACILNKESALNVFTTLPTYTSGTHRITVGIHIDHQGDADIAEAVAEAEGKGWTVTVQWNGTASAAGASTWGLRRQTIFARVIEREAVDGSICRVLDWGHYVTAPAGYEEFSSVEAAQQALGLTNENN